MKNELREIYQKLSDGELSKERALEMIRVLKENNSSLKGTTIYAKPEWKKNPITHKADMEKRNVGREYVITIDILDKKFKKALNRDSNIDFFDFETSVKLNLAQNYNLISEKTFSLVKTILSDKSDENIFLQIIISESNDNTILSGLYGLLKTAKLENPKFSFQLIYVEKERNDKELMEKINLCKYQAGSEFIKIENNAIKIKVLKECSLAEKENIFIFKNNGTYLITGGLGGLGVLFTKEILEKLDKSTIILIGRKPLNQNHEKILSELNQRGKRCYYKQCDISKKENVETLLNFVKGEFGSLNGIIHAAGVTNDNFIIKKSLESVQNVLKPKVQGCYNLDAATSDLELDFFVNFSSVASCLGNLGQADYALANGFLDQYANYRNELVDKGIRYGQTITVNWPLWDEGGLSIDKQTKEIMIRNTSLGSLDTSEGINAFYEIFKYSESQMLVLHGDKNEMQDKIIDKAFRFNVIKENFNIKKPQNLENSLGYDLDKLKLKSEEYLIDVFSKVLKISRDKIDTKEPLEKYGIDSILSMDLTSELENTFGSLSKTLFFEYQTLNELTNYFWTSYKDSFIEMFGNQEIKNDIDKNHNENRLEEKLPNLKSYEGSNRFKTDHKNMANNISDEMESIAIVGLSGRYPESININEFWSNLKNGKDCIIEVPKERWDWRKYFNEDRTKSGYHYSKWGGFISGVDEFDPRFFNISPKEANFIDPQERLFLQHAWMAVEDAGYSRKGLQIIEEDDLSGQVGVYAGVMFGEYQLFGAEQSVKGNRMGIANSYASIANRVSYALNLHGPSMTLDTMCSSSLTAIHLACQDLKLKRTKMAIAGGVNVSIHPNKYLVLSAGQFISSAGNCQSFGEGGEGYIPGEGVGVVVLKRLSEAIKDGNHIYGIIRGSSLNHGGKTNGYSVPNPNAQASVISRALKESKIDPRHISYIEAHGTGTKLGDPIEITALCKAFENKTTEQGFCEIGSVKSNIGHCESAAAIAGLTKVLLQLKYKKIVPSLHSEKLNPYIDFNKTPFVVNQKLHDWESMVVDGVKIPRIAGLSSFGAGGSNAHLLIEEYNPVNYKREKILHSSGIDKYAIVLSARTNEQLEQKIKDLLVFIKDKKKQSIDLNSISYTLQLGRESMEIRFALLVDTLESLIENLEIFLKGNTIKVQSYQGRKKEYKRLLSEFDTELDLKNEIEDLLEQNNISKLLNLWVKGSEVDWNSLYGRIKPNLVSLPTYPFAKEKYWIDSIDETDLESNNITEQRIHPLVHRNTSNITFTKFSSQFNGDEQIIKDINISNLDNGNFKLSASIHLEMVRASIERALSENESIEGSLVLSNMVWSNLNRIDQNSLVNIVLIPSDLNSIKFEIFTLDKKNEVINFQGDAKFKKINTPRRHDINKILETFDGNKLTKEDFYNKSRFGESYHVIETIYKDHGKILSQLRVPKKNQDSIKNYKLHPVIVESIMQLATEIIQVDGKIRIEKSVPISIDKIEVFSSCTSNMFAWVRLGKEMYNSNNKIDVDLCDNDGNVCVKMQGIKYRAVQESNIIQESNNEDKINNEAIFKSSNKIIFEDLNEDINSLEPISKPKNIVLNAINSDDKIDVESIYENIQRVTLSDTKFNHKTYKNNKDDDIVTLYSEGSNIYSLYIKNDQQDNTLSKIIIEKVISALKELKSNNNVKTLLLHGDGKSFLTGNREIFNYAIDLNLFNEIAGFKCPVISVLKDGAMGLGFLIGLISDFIILSETGKYSYFDGSNNLYPSKEELKLFIKRFGFSQSLRFLYSSKECSANELRQIGFSCPTFPINNFDENVKEFALSLAKKPIDSLKLLKLHTNDKVIKMVDALMKIDVHEKFKELKQNVKLNDLNFKPKCFNFISIDNGILEIKIKNSKNKFDIRSLISEISDVFAEIKKKSNVKMVIMSSDFHDFIPNDICKKHESDIIKFGKEIIDFPKPIIATFENDLEEYPFYLAQFFDERIYANDSSYSSKNMPNSKVLFESLFSIFSCNFGKSAAMEILLSGVKYTGTELGNKARSTEVVLKDNCYPRLQEIATLWGALPLDDLIEMKNQRRNEFEKLGKDIPSWEKINKKPKKSSNEIGKLKNDNVKISILKDDVVEIRIEDRESKNMFSEAVTRELFDAFEFIENSNEFKVAILTGYDTYFASGGTKETLLAIQSGKAKFTDKKIYQLALSCKIPVISAMQGHGIGAGWAMGMFADIVVFAQESKYNSPYMGYGFTPGAGATYVFPEKMGLDIGRETLFSADSYSGEELKYKGINFPVVTRNEVLNVARKMADDIVNFPLEVLINLKNIYRSRVIHDLNECYDGELSMHEKTFVGKHRTLKQIEETFDKNENQDVSAEEERHKEKIVSYNAGSDLKVSIAEKLIELLAVELHLEVDEIDEDMQFIDLGLDSITGVTWINKINEVYETTIEATKVYSYPTVELLTEFVMKEANIEFQTSNDIKVINKSELIVEDKTINDNITDDISLTIKKLLADELHLDVEEIEDDTPFIDLGLDSITGVTWIKKINDHYTTTIEATKIYSYPTIIQLSEFVRSEAKIDVEQILEKVDTYAQDYIESDRVINNEDSENIEFDELISIRNKKSKKSVSKVQAIEPIAVIGMSGQFPQAKNVNEFWNNISEGKNCISEVSEKRWDLNKYYKEGNSAEGKTNSKWLGALDGYDLFDPIFFNISPVEAESMDPQQRLFLQSCWNCVEDAGYNTKSLSGSKCGVFVGCTTGDYHLLTKDLQVSAQGFTGGAMSVLAARISYLLNLQGPCISIDTACSSSLVAISNACDSLSTGSSDMAIAGGVYVMVGPDLHIKTAQSGMLSTDGRCFTFDQRANGFVPGESVGAVMLKRLSDAERDNDTIYGVISGWGVNQDGKTNGITAPNAQSQTRLEQDVYDRFKINPDEIQLIEAHGTGTKLGDPIEVDALKQSFGKYTNNKNYCALGSVKSNIGHCLTAAGVAGFIKIIQSIKNRKLPPTINFENLNEHIDLGDSPFYVNTELKDWDVEPSMIRQAAISAFGFSGTNAHLVISEYENESINKRYDSVITQNGKVIVPLSAKNEIQLKQRLQNLLEQLEAEIDSIDLYSVSYTLQTGRDDMDFRIGFLVNSIPDLIEMLKSYLDGNNEVNDCYFGKVEENKASMKFLKQDAEIRQTVVEKWIKERKLNKLLSLWVKGLEMDWAQLYVDVKPNKVNLPGYPFAEDRYWVDERELIEVIIDHDVTNEKLHPLLHSKVVDLGMNVKAESLLLSESQHRSKPNLISLPSYPFARERHWVEDNVENVKMSKKEDVKELDVESIEGVLEKIDENSIDSAKAIELLKELT